MAVADVFDGAAQVYLAVRTRSGPNVTPELFTLSDGRLLCLTSVATLKAKLLRKDPVVGIAARTDGCSVAAVGTVEVLDLPSPVDVGRFLRDNAAEMAGAAVDALAGRLGRPLPPRRVALAITPADPVTGPATGDAVLGWTRADGTPLALPAEWDDDRKEATVPAALFTATGAAPSSAACVTLDSWTNYGPTGKQGVMLRGTGQAEIDGETAVLRFELDRSTSWHGVTIGTDPLPSQ
jgi:hypothetical protein